MEAEFALSVEVNIDYEVGSPPDDGIDPYAVAEPCAARWEFLWMTREGPSHGVVGSTVTKLYPPFTDILRRTVFCVLQFGTPGTTTVTWNAVAVPVHRLFFSTDSEWLASGIVVNTLGEGAWFACEGELEADYGIWKPGTP